MRPLLFLTKPLLVAFALGPAPAALAQEDADHHDEHATSHDEADAHGDHDDHYDHEEHGHEGHEDAQHEADAHGDDADDVHLAEAGDLRILHAWTNATDDDTARVFMEVQNTGAEPVVVIGGEAAIATGHGVEGVPLTPDGDPVPLSDGLPVGGGRDVALSPDGAYLRLTGLTADLVEGETFDMTLLLEPGRRIEVTVEVFGESVREHPHAGHEH